MSTLSRFIFSLLFFGIFCINEEKKRGNFSFFGGKYNVQASKASFFDGRFSFLFRKHNRLYPRRTLVHFKARSLGKSFGDGFRSFLCYLRLWYGCFLPARPVYKPKKPFYSADFIGSRRKRT